MTRRGVDREQAPAGLLGSLRGGSAPRESCLGSFNSRFPWREAALSSLLGELVFEIRSKRLQRGLLWKMTSTLEATQGQILSQSPTNTRRGSICMGVGQRNYPFAPGLPPGRWGRPLLSKLACAEDGTIVFLHPRECEGSPYPGFEFLVGVLNKRCVLPPL